MEKIFIVLVLCAVQLGFAQQQKEVDAGNFSTLSVYDKIEVTLVASDKNKVVISAHEVESVNVINKNGDLKIKMNLANSFQGDDVKATVYFKSLTEITAGEGSVIKSSDIVKATALDVNAKTGSNIDLKIDADRLNVKAGSGSVAKLTGKAGVQDIVSNSGAKVKNKDLISSQTSVTVNAGGQAEVNATELVNAKTRAGGEILIYGNPKTVKEKTVAGGIIKQVNK